jgi:predicted phosphodiesterase
MNAVAALLVAASLATGAAGPAAAGPAAAGAAGPAVPGAAGAAAPAAPAAPAAAVPAGPGATGRAAPGDTVPVRIFFISDVHSRHRLMDRFIAAANRERPGLILDGGDLVHDGTASEYARAVADRGRLDSPWRAVRGNHDAQLRGPFPSPPPAIAGFQAFEHEDIRFILLDNHTGLLGDEQFVLLEAELRAHAGRRVVVVQHVPPFLARPRAVLRLRQLLPFRLASPVMRDAAEVHRFQQLMRRHQVLAVLAGHAHYHDHVLRDGVHYIVAGAAGGLTPGLGIANEYLDISIAGRELVYQRVRLHDPAGDPVRFVARAFRFYTDLNGFNHATQGWNYVPSVSVQLRSGLKSTERGGTRAYAMQAVASFERTLGVAGRHAFVADVGVSAGERELAGHLLAGYRVRPVGDFNRNMFIAGAATGNAGMLNGSATAGLGVAAGIGFEWRSVTAELSRNVATNHGSTMIGFGRRF